MSILWTTGLVGPRSNHHYVVTHWYDLRMSAAPLIRKTVPLPAPLIGELEDRAAHEGVTFSEAIRRVLKQGLGIAPASGSRRDRAAVLLGQLLRTHIEQYDLDLLKMDELGDFKDLAKVAWECSGYLEEMGE